MNVHVTGTDLRRTAGTRGVYRALCLSCGAVVMRASHVTVPNRNCVHMCRAPAPSGGDTHVHNGRLDAKATSVRTRDRGGRGDTAHTGSHGRHLP